MALFWYVMVCLFRFIQVQLHLIKGIYFKNIRPLFLRLKESKWSGGELQLDYSALTSGQKIGLTAKDKASMKLPDSRKINLLIKDEEN